MSLSENVVCMLCLSLLLLLDDLSQHIMELVIREYLLFYNSYVQHIFYHALAFLATILINFNSF